MTYDFLDPLSRPLIEAGIIAVIGLLFLAWRRYRTTITLVLVAVAWDP